MRLILAAAALAALTLPAQAQRLDTRVRNVVTNPNGSVGCTSTANPALRIVHAADGGNASAKLFQPLVKRDPALEVAIGFGFKPTPGTRFDAGTYFYGARIELNARTPDLAVANARLLLDGHDGGFRPIVTRGKDNARIIFLTTPNDETHKLGEAMLRVHWIDLELLDSHGAVLRRYRFDGFAIANAAETVSIVKFSCRGPKGD